MPSASTTEQQTIANTTTLDGRKPGRLKRRAEPNVKAHSGRKKTRLQKEDTLPSQPRPNTGAEPAISTTEDDDSHGFDTGTTPSSADVVEAALQLDETSDQSPDITTGNTHNPGYLMRSRKWKQDQTLISTTCHRASKEIAGSSSSALGLILVDGDDKLFETPLPEVHGSSNSGVGTSTGALLSEVSPRRLRPRSATPALSAPQAPKRRSNLSRAASVVNSNLKGQRAAKGDGAELKSTREISGKARSKPLPQNNLAEAIAVSSLASMTDEPIEECSDGSQFSSETKPTDTNKNYRSPSNAGEVGKNIAAAVDISQNLGLQADSGASGVGDNIANDDSTSSVHQPSTSGSNQLLGTVAQTPLGSISSGQDSHNSTSTRPTGVPYPATLQHPYLYYSYYPHLLGQPISGNIAATPGGFGYPFNAISYSSSATQVSTNYPSTYYPLPENLHRGLDLSISSSSNNAAPPSVPWLIVQPPASTTPNPSQVTGSSSGHAIPAASGQTFLSVPDLNPPQRKERILLKGRDANSEEHSGSQNNVAIPQAGSPIPGIPSPKPLSDNSIGARVKKGDPPPRKVVSDIELARLIQTYEPSTRHLKSADHLLVAPRSAGLTQGHRNETHSSMQFHAASPQLPADSNRLLGKLDDSGLHIDEYMFPEDLQYAESSTSAPGSANSLRRSVSISSIKSPLPALGPPLISPAGGESSLTFPTENRSLVTSLPYTMSTESGEQPTSSSSDKETMAGNGSEGNSTGISLHARPHTPIDLLADSSSSRMDESRQDPVPASIFDTSAKGKQKADGAPSVPKRKESSYDQKPDKAGGSSKSKSKSKSRRKELINDISARTKTLAEEAAKLKRALHR
ncbi:hypothetical protein FRC03_003477 [Tulasnella sp. 419]|nr:hypothetical protein FRC03_003477 [Tulasnella sp. 419]